MRLKIGIIGRADNCGLGILTQEFYEHLKPTKTILLFNKKYKHYLDRFPEGECIGKTEFSDDKVKKFLTGLDLVIAFESPYNWNTFDIAREMGVKSVLIPMYEYLKVDTPKPDLYICPSLLDFDLIEGNKVFLNIPVNRKKLIRRKPFRVKTFLFNAGHGGKYNRNLTQKVISAMQLVKSDVKLIVNTQKDIDYEESPKVEVRWKDEYDYKDLYSRGDVFLFPQRFCGLSMPIQEAMSVGLPVVTTDIYPLNVYIPQKLLIKTSKMPPIKVYRLIDTYDTTKKDIAAKIEEIAQMSSEELGRYSDLMDEYAENISWRKMLPKYKKEFEKLCK